MVTPNKLTLGQVACIHILQVKVYPNKDIIACPIIVGIVKRSPILQSHHHSELVAIKYEMTAITLVLHHHHCYFRAEKGPLRFIVIISHNSNDL